MEIDNHLAEWRKRRGFAVADLAERIGVSRQTVYAIEAGTYVPNTIVSLRLAQVLETAVEKLFALPAVPRRADEIMEVTLLGEHGDLPAGQMLRLCYVRGATAAVVISSGAVSLPSADATLLNPVGKPVRNRTVQVRVLHQRWRSPARILLAGCDPSAAILGDFLNAELCDLMVTYENSTRSLELLREGLVHVAGTHLSGSTKGKGVLGPIRKVMGRAAIAVFSYAMWEEGILTAHGNPKKITGVDGLLRSNIRFANRESGAGCRTLLDDLIADRGISPRRINGYQRIAEGHLPAARMVAAGEVDCCIGTGAVAHALGLHLVPLARKNYQLVVRRSQLNHPPTQQMLQTLSLDSFRREVEAGTGYSMRNAGDRLI
jgi:putative molybdopterin biosynthesis protein